MTARRASLAGALIALGLLAAGTVPAAEPDRRGAEIQRPTREPGPTRQIQPDAERPRPQAPAARTPTPARPPASVPERRALPEAGPPPAMPEGRTPPGATRPFALERVRTVCARPGGIVQVTGVDGAVDAARLVATGGHGQPPVTLAPLRAGTSLTLPVPHDAPLAPGTRYEVQVRGAGAAAWRTVGTDLPVCADAGQPASERALAPGAGAGDGDPGQGLLLATIRVRGSADLGPVFAGTIDSLVAALADQGLAVAQRRDHQALGLVVLRLRPDGSLQAPALIDRLRAIEADFPGVAFASDALYRASAGGHYAAQMVGLSGGAQASCRRDGGALAVGLLDGAIDTAHPTIAAATAPVETAAFTDGAPPPASDHATALAALLVGRSERDGFAGVLTGHRLLAAAALSDVDGSLSGAASNLIAGLDWLVARGADLALLAWEGPPNAALELALLAGADRGTLFFAAAGNGGPQRPVAYPAASRWTMAITAVDADRNIYARAARGPEVAFAAPGVDIRAPAADASWRYYSGTSFAVPFAAAVAAQYVADTTPATRSGRNALRVRADLARQLAATAKDLGARGRDPIYGWGLARACAPGRGPDTVER